ncbi:50S ribosomal protein L25/general stress protein Ctc [Chondromyces apiculatus]|uniref:Large ribosomal subunit protein bL25 n=1 Tax=Chondromyces apiculatus DSM 436 TaxID=1192034 RepID=A0A017T4S5_9BACT|nr:50S ribosomal protein L25/general stress protein Ctc [Chondromyces apiculatus]EYF04234.1 LSU ribosomal protein L25p [Chondromyces apiculatus DSM 436]
MEIIKLNATRRVESGKSSAGRLRRQEQIPAVAYGRTLAPIQVAVAPKALTQILSSAHGQNSVVELVVEGGETLTVMVRDFDYHPISRVLIHADFLQVNLDQPVDVEVPFRCTGKAKGIVSGGILQQIFRTIPVRCLPEKIPSVIEIDVSDLDVGDALKASALKLEEGVKVRLPEEQTIVVLAAPEKAGAEEEAKPGAPGAAAAPAAAAGAGAKAAAAPAKKDEKKK